MLKIFAPVALLAGLAFPAAASPLIQPAVSTGLDGAKIIQVYGGCGPYAYYDDVYGTCVSYGYGY